MGAPVRLAQALTPPAAPAASAARGSRGKASDGEERRPWGSRPPPRGSPRRAEAHLSAPSSPVSQAYLRHGAAEVGPGADPGRRRAGPRGPPRLRPPTSCAAPRAEAARRAGQVGGRWAPRRAGRAGTAGRADCVTLRTGPRGAHVTCGAAGSRLRSPGRSPPPAPAARGPPAAPTAAAGRRLPAGVGLGRLRSETFGRAPTRRRCLLLQEALLEAALCKAPAAAQSPTLWNL